MQNRRKILVTGANRGIGLALVQLLAQRADCTIIMAFRDSNRGIQEKERLMKQYPMADIRHHTLDLMNSNSRNQFVQFVQNQLKSFDVLVNNAALGYDEPINIPPLDIASSYLNCNVTSTILLTEQLLPYLSSDGKIINVSSRVGALENHSKEVSQKLRNPNITREDIMKFVQEYVDGCSSKTLVGWSLSAYRTSKTLLNAWSRFVLMRQLKENQSVLVMSPGFCLTDMVINNHDSKNVKAPPPKTPEQGANTIIFCIYDIPYNQSNSGKFFYDNKQWNYETNF